MLRRVDELKNFVLDRRDAGRRLANELRHYAEDRDVLVLALPRGGVPVAYEAARDWFQRFLSGQEAR